MFKINMGIFFLLLFSWRCPGNGIVKVQIAHRNNLKTNGFPHIFWTVGSVSVFFLLLYKNIKNGFKRHVLSSDTNVEKALVYFAGANMWCRTKGTVQIEKVQLFPYGTSPRLWDCVLAHTDIKSTVANNIGFMEVRPSPLLLFFLVHLEYQAWKSISKLLFCFFFLLFSSNTLYKAWMYCIKLYDCTLLFLILVKVMLCNDI